MRQNSVVRTMFYECDLPSCTKRYFKFPCAEHSDEPQKAEIMFASGLHDFLSFISIAQKETLHVSFVQSPTYFSNQNIRNFLYRTSSNKEDIVTV